MPENPCTYAKEKDWGQCVWEQIQPFVEDYVTEQIDDAFASLWKTDIQGFQRSLYNMNFTAYTNSCKYGKCVDGVGRPFTERV